MEIPILAFHYFPRLIIWKWPWVVHVTQAFQYQHCYVWWRDPHNSVHLFILACLWQYKLLQIGWWCNIIFVAAINMVIDQDWRPSSILKLLFKSKLFIDDLSRFFYHKIHIFRGKHCKPKTNRNWIDKILVLASRHFPGRYFENNFVEDAWSKLAATLEFQPFDDDQAICNYFILPVTRKINNSVVNSVYPW